MTPVRIQPEAARDLLRIADFLSSQSYSGEVGERFLNAAEATTRLLGSAPLLGRHRPSSNLQLGALRCLAVKRPFDRYLFYYQPTEAAIVILRVSHAAQSAYHLLDVEPETSA